MAEELKTKIGELDVKLKEIKAGAIMTRAVETTMPMAHLADVADRLIEKRISGMPVVGKEGKVVGVVTTTDLLIVMGIILDGAGLADGRPSIDPTVDFAMSADIVTVHPDTALDEVLALMRTKSIHTIPVIENGKLVGIVGKRDVLKKFYEIVRGL
jgi:CBS domain-containing protein